MNKILTDYLNGLPIITVPLSLFAIIALFSGMTQFITNEHPKPILVAASQLYIVFR